MPTCYTAYIEEGNIDTGRDFILLCTLAFGVAMEIRDEPLSIPTPKVFEPNIKYYTDCLERAIAEKARLTKLSKEEWHEECVKNREERIQKTKQEYETAVELDKKYLKVKHEVEERNPPDNCKEIKKFALEQIQISRPNLNHYLEWIALAEREDPDEDQYETRMESCERDIAYAQERIAEETKRAEEKTLFIKELCDSLRESFGEDNGTST